MAIEGTLLDDGTMDTVIECTCSDCGHTWEERFSCESAADYRDSETGCLDEDHVAELLADENVECPNCIDGELNAIGDYADSME